VENVYGQLTMKILLVYPSPLSNVFFHAYAEGLTAAGHEVAVCTGSASTFSSVFRLPYGTKTFEVNLPRSASLPAHFAAVSRLRRVVEAFQPDVVHAHMSAAVFTTAMARRWSQPTIGTFHGLRHAIGGRLSRYVFGLAERAAIRRLDQVQVVNAQDYGMVQRECPHADCVLLRAGFGCDLQQFDPARFSPAMRVETRRELELQATDVVAAFVGRMVAFKGVPQMIKAFRLVAAEERNAKLLVIGDRDPLHPTGLDRDDDRWLRETDVVRITGFTRSPERYLSAADYLVLPSGREGLSTAIMEALCMGLPVVTTTARGCGDLVDEGVTGWLVPPGNHLDLAMAIRSAIRDPQGRQARGRAALAQRHRLDRAACIREALDIYATITQAHAHSDAGSLEPVQPASQRL
jgi:glycosyltransferase involved in cell wall biosynthesis